MKDVAAMMVSLSALSVALERLLWLWIYIFCQPLKIETRVTHIYLLPQTRRCFSKYDRSLWVTNIILITILIIQSFEFHFIMWIIYHSRTAYSNRMRILHNWTYFSSRKAVCIFEAEALVYVKLCVSWIVYFLKIKLPSSWELHCIGIVPMSFNQKLHGIPLEHFYFLDYTYDQKQYKIMC